MRASSQLSCGLIWLPGIDKSPQSVATERDDTVVTFCLDDNYIFGLDEEQKGQRDWSWLRGDCIQTVDLKKWHMNLWVLGIKLNSGRSDPWTAEELTRQPGSLQWSGWRRIKTLLNIWFIYEDIAKYTQRRWCMWFTLTYARKMRCAAVCMSCSCWACICAAFD